MGHYLVKIELACDAERSNADIADMFDDVVDHLRTKLGSTYATATILGAEGVAIVSVDVEAPSIDDAYTKGASMIRAAVHAVGVGTPGWPSPSEHRVEITA